MNILLINCDWRDTFRNDFNELYEKFQRDHLEPDKNSFYIFSFARASYEAVHAERFHTVHHKIRLFFKPLFDIASFFLVPAMLAKAKVKPDVVLVYDFGFLPAAWRIRKKTGAKIAMYVTNMPQIYSRTRKFGFIKSWYSWLLERLWKGIPDEYFTLNDTMKKYITNFGVPESKIHFYSVNTIARDMKFIRESRPGMIRPRFNIPQEAKVLICVARLEAEKGYERLFDLFAALPSDHHLIVLGEGSLRQKLTEQARQLGVLERVHMPGFVQRSEIWNYYKDADMFVLLSKAEALGIVLWEAMYAGIPVLGSDVDGIVESIGAHEERGYILKMHDGAEAFKAKVEAALADTEEKKAKVAGAKAFVEKGIADDITINKVMQPQ